MGFGKNSIEWVVIILYDLFPVFLPSDHAQRRFDTTSGISFASNIC